MHDRDVLWYAEPARNWCEALPLGNGRLGAMVFGGAPRERIQFNEETLWSGFPRDHTNPDAIRHLPPVRDALFAGDYTLADKIARQMQGPFTQSFLPCGDLFLESDQDDGNTTGYRRWLDLDTAVHHVTYGVGVHHYRRECFISSPANVLVLRLISDQVDGLNMRIRLESILPSWVQLQGQMLLLSGNAPEQADPHYIRSEHPIVYGPAGMTFAARVGVKIIGGSLHVHGNTFHVTGASEIILLLCAATSFNGFDRSPVAQGKDPLAITARILEAALPRAYEELLAEHLAEYQPRFRRVTLRLGNEEPRQLPTVERIAAYAQAPEPALAELLFQYGRYLLIASSRPHTQPATLQGIWNQDIQPAWSSNYTININTQMNYWPAETTNLADCATALFDFLQGLSVNGKKIAETNYGARGWCSHHNSDIWRHAAPAGNYGWGSPCWASFPLSGAWLCTHLWEHYSFGGDRDFLARVAYPIMKGAAEFCLDWLIDDGNGHLVTGPSTSAENVFVTQDGVQGEVSMATAFDMAIIGQHFENCIAAAAALDVDAPFAQRLSSARARLYPFQIGGQRRHPGVVARLGSG
ncbi:MAG: glycoside hydrolase family 95 protein [Anaerolineales bacterium]|nr:glycoside hydrolase family 95 protein [Anaerolineales bacterium]